MLSNLAADRSRIADIDAQIASLENSVLRLKNERRSVQKRLDAYTYPVLTLPYDIVSTIFVEFIPTFPSCPPLFGPLSPTSLGHICRTWRTIAFSTPVLWRAISFGVSAEAEQGRVDLGFELFESWLARSCSLPLSIQLEQPTTTSSPPFLTSFILAILPHFLRVEHLKLFCMIDLQQIPLHLEYSMPSLRSLELLCPWFRKSDVHVAAFFNAPQLQSVHLRFLDKHSLLQLPWGQLTGLVLDSVRSEVHVQILNQTVNLVHCRLTRPYSRYDESLPDSATTLACLQSLEFDGSSSSFLHRLSLPALRHVKIVNILNDIECVYNLRSCVARSGCTLQKLHLIKVPSSRARLTIDMVRAEFPSVPTILMGAKAEE
ncbi:hypothetical protein B0H19DRAFT_1103588 [Mycena capillaripes]|nr:hypothetical protein B0H19DRAFT_1103588 [Mycena capillaripes]